MDWVVGGEITRDRVLRRVGAWVGTHASCPAFEGASRPPPSLTKRGMGVSRWPCWPGIYQRLATRSIARRRSWIAFRGWVSCVGFDLKGLGWQKLKAPIDRKGSCAHTKARWAARRCWKGGKGAWRVGGLSGLGGWQGGGEGTLSWGVRWSVCLSVQMVHPKCLTKGSAPCISHASH